MKKLSSFFVITGFSLIILSLVIFVLTFLPILVMEINFSLRESEKKSEKNILYPLDKGFGIIIPKIGANAKIIPNVNPYNEKVYQLALTKGVAHSKGTAFPGEVGNIFLFSHSSQNFYEARRYNSIFYLLTKLKKDDDVYLFYKNKEFKYKVIDKKIVDSNSISYLVKNGPKQTLTLMTCWPPGTTFKRLLVLAEISK